MIPVLRRTECINLSISQFYRETSAYYVNCREGGGDRTKEEGGGEKLEGDEQKREKREKERREERTKAGKEERNSGPQPE